MTARPLLKDINAAKEYAASKTVIDNNKKVKSFPLWVASEERTRVDKLAWVPGQPMFCQSPEGNAGGTAFNTWRGLTPMRAPDNWRELVKPFQEHLDYLIPIESERLRFVQWLAHIFQYPEELPHTCYLMVTPTMGIGRNWMASVLTRALRGHVAAGVALPELLDGSFNGRLSHKLLAVVDELHEGAGNQRYQRAEGLKTTITQDLRQINPKYGVQSVEKNCCRWLMFSNHFDALPFPNKDRRVEVIANPTECREEAYYIGLYSLLEDQAFIASVREMLMNVNLRSFSAGAHAKMSEAKQRAISEMKTDVEHKMEDFKDDCKTTLVSRRNIDAKFTNAYGKLEISSTQLTHSIATAGMVNSGRRVKDSNGIKHSVVIVDTAVWTIEKVMAASASTVLKAMGFDTSQSGGAASGEDDDPIPF